MRLIFRVIGTWLIAMALILLIIDGTKSLAANALITTSLRESWTGLHAASLGAVEHFLSDRMFEALLVPGFNALLSLPGFAVIGVPGLLLAFAGRSRRSRLFIRQSQI